MAKKNPNKHIIWSNYDLNLEDWREGIEEMWEMNEIDSSTKTEDDYIEEMYLLSSEYFYDEQANLNIPPKDVLLPSLIWVYGTVEEQATSLKMKRISELVFRLMLIVVMENGGLILITIFALSKLTMMVPIIFCIGR